MNDLDYFKATFGLREEDVLLVPFGSRVYGTHGDDSDYDYLAIVPTNRRALSGQEYRRHQVNIQVYNRHDFQKDLDLHRIHALEAYYMPDGAVREACRFRLSKRALRAELVRKASHSFVRARKKMEVEHEPHLGRKSLFHALRILTFGAQIARRGGIDYGAANEHWFAIRDAGRDDWAYFKERYQPLYNRLASDLRKATAEE
jgi:hypothetical protein